MFFSYRLHFFLLNSPCSCVYSRATEQQPAYIWTMKKKPSKRKPFAYIKIKWIWYWKYSRCLLFYRLHNSTKHFLYSLEPRMCSSVHPIRANVVHNTYKLFIYKNCPKKGPLSSTLFLLCTTILYTYSQQYTKSV